VFPLPELHRPHFFYYFYRLLLLLSGMNWDQLLSVQRLGQPVPTEINAESRTQFQRDYDRIIFSGPFRRMQNKTQVFPLPGSVFVHNRLTHSLEVASVGRSMGNMLRDHLEQSGHVHPLISEIGSVVAAACLAHDMGNPPFGHSGEDAIKSFFTKNSGRFLAGQLEPSQWSDLAIFDGNANAFRLLAHQFNGRRAGGFALTYTMLASIVKYPYESQHAVKPKFGFFQSEKDIFAEIAKALGMKGKGENGIAYCRHPLVYLVEAADDICYQVMDVEDAHKLKILSYDETCSLFLDFFDRVDDKAVLGKISRTFSEVTDRNEQISFLRATVIGRLVNECVRVFIDHEETIMNGDFEGSLIKRISPVSALAMKNVVDVSVNRIYADPSVIEIELAGYKIISTLMDVFIEAVLTDSVFGKKLMKLFPEQFKPSRDDTYSKVQSVVDYISGMTDVYALELYRKITGITIPGI
jgi:dGTPase